MIHADPYVDLAMRANLGAGFHFFDPDNQRFHRSRSVSGVLSACKRHVYVVERYRTVTMGGHTVQTPHSRVVRVTLATGETEYMTALGRPTSEMVDGKYVANGETCQYATNRQARRAAEQFAKEEGS